MFLLHEAVTKFVTCELAPGGAKQVRLSEGANVCRKFVCRIRLAARCQRSARRSGAERRERAPRRIRTSMAATASSSSVDAFFALLEVWEFGQASFLAARLRGRQMRLSAALRSGWNYYNLAGWVGTMIRYIFTHVLGN